MTKPNIDNLTKVYAKYFGGLYNLPKNGTPEYKETYDSLRRNLRKDLEILGIATNFDFELVLVGAKTKEAAKKQTAAKVEADQVSTSSKSELKKQTIAKHPLKIKITEKIKTPKNVFFARGFFANKDKIFAKDKL